MENTGDDVQYVDRVSSVFNLAFHTFKNRYITNGGSMNDTRLLHAAAFSGNTNLVKIVIEAGADINKDNNGFTPLTIATWNNWTETVLVLVELGANAEIPTASGWTSLMMAAFKGLNHIVKILVESNVDVNKTWNKTGYGALHLAVEKNHTEVVSLLLDHNADMDIQNNDGFTPLLIAAFKGFNQIVKILLESNVDVDKISNETGAGALHLAVQENHTEIVSLLLDHNADMDIQNNYGYTPLLVAAELGFFKISKLLIDNGASFNGTYLDPFLVAGVHSDISVYMLEQFKVAELKPFHYGLVSKNDRIVSIHFT